EVPVVGPANALNDAAGISQRAALDVEPTEIAEVRGLDDERVFAGTASALARTASALAGTASALARTACALLPVADGVAVPPGLDVLRHGPPVGEDLTEAGVGFIDDGGEVGGLE